MDVNDSFCETHLVSDRMELVEVARGRINVVARKVCMRNAANTTATMCTLQTCLMHPADRDHTYTYMCLEDCWRIIATQEAHVTILFEPESFLCDFFDLVEVEVLA